ncbi:hypothetical protein SCUP515_02583 [Seiridium cupressi]
MTPATPKAAPKPMPTLAPEDSPREDALEESDAVPEVVAAVLEEYDIVPRGVLVDESTVLVEDNASSTKGWTDLDSSRFTVPKSKAFGSPVMYEIPITHGVARQAELRACVRLERLVCAGPTYDCTLRQRRLRVARIATYFIFQA